MDREIKEKPIFYKLRFTRCKFIKDLMWGLRNVSTRSILLILLSALWFDSYLFISISDCYSSLFILERENVHFKSRIWIITFLRIRTTRLLQFDLDSKIHFLACLYFPPYSEDYPNEISESNPVATQKYKELRVRAIS